MLARWPTRLVGAPQRLMGMSLPARVAIVMFVFLVVLIVTAFLAFYVSQDDPIWREWVRPRWVIPTLLLAAAIPVLTYYTLKLWLAGEVTEFPDIEEAWRAGTTELERQGIDLQAAPLFLVLGVHDADQADALMAAADVRFRVAGFPDRRAPLRWYAREDAVYVVATEVGSLSVLQQRAASGGRGLESGRPASNASPAGGDIRGTLVTAPSQARSAAAPAVGIADSYPSSGGAALVQGTLMPGTTLQSMAAATPAALSRGLSPGEQEQQSARLHFLGRLVKGSRQPYCPLNGLLTVIAWPALDEVLLADGLAGSARHDLGDLYAVTELCCPVTILVSGMEREPGFAELVRRVGAERAGQGRFGKGYEVWSRPSAENLDALSSHACGAFEDWVYTLFKEPQALQKPGNGKLYALMCKIRGEIQVRLRNILVRGFAWDDNDQPGMRLSGCYFAATGGSADQRAFVKSVIHKMSEMEGELDWSQAARSRNGWFYQLARFGMVLDGILLVAVIAMLIYHFGWNR
jgi:hypothetical protein